MHLISYFVFLVCSVLILFYCVSLNEEEKNVGLFILSLNNFTKLIKFYFRRCIRDHSVYRIQKSLMLFER